MHQGYGLPNDECSTPKRRFAALHSIAFRNWLLVLTLSFSGPVLAAGFSCTPPADSGKEGTLQELEEVVITGEEAASDPKDMRAWLGLLVGQYTYEGQVDLCGRNNAKDLRPVTGKANCIGSGSTPNVQCTVNVRWPAARGENGAPVLGGVSNLFPALVVYSLEAYILVPRTEQTPSIRRWRIMFMQLDNRGVAEWGSGQLVGDTFVSSEPCVGIQGDCQKITRITAKPDSNEMFIVIDVKVDSRRVLRQSFLLHRDLSAATGEPIEGSQP